MKLGCEEMAKVNKNTGLTDRMTKPASEESHMDEVVLQ